MKAIIVSPAGRTDEKYINGAANVLRSWGISVEIALHARGKHAHYSGTVEERLSDLQHALNDPTIDIIFCARGGYGCVHLITELKIPRNCKKWLVGFSDITALHALMQKHGLCSLHAPMAKHLYLTPNDDECSLRLKKIFMGKNPDPIVVNINDEAQRKLIRTGSAKGVLRGGNLSVLCSLVGTSFDFPNENVILVVEDIGERPYQVERMLYNLKLAGKLDKLKGLIIGQFTQYEEDEAIGCTLHEAIANVVGAVDYPVTFDFPIGHVTKNIPLILGAKYQLDVTPDQTRLSYLK